MHAYKLKFSSLVKAGTLFCVRCRSDDDKGTEPAAKKVKLMADDDISGGLPDLLKQKVTEVSAGCHWSVHR